MIATRAMTAIAFAGSAVALWWIFKAWLKTRPFH